MPYLITPVDLAAFQRCHRQWDLGASARQNLEPLLPAQGHPRVPALGAALREALDIYYFPGMWDWQRQITLPLVRQGFERAVTALTVRGAQDQACGQMEDGAWEASVQAGRHLLEQYFSWAPGVDRFSPVLVEAEYDVSLLDPADPERALLTPDGEPVRYRGQIGMLAVDANDAYWIVQHRLVDGEWPSASELAGDEEAVAACWAWEQFYLGMAITGTICNEMRPGALEQAGPRRSGVSGRWWPSRRKKPAGRVRQHEPSGGGRSIPQHRRMYAVAKAPDRAERIEQQVTPGFRRTWIRRTPAEVAEAGRKLAEKAAQMTAAGVGTDPTPSPASCPSCPYLAPCQAMMAGRDPTPLLRSRYRERPPQPLAEGRLGGGAWGLGRGAAPPKFRGPR
jgi:hypothetical protein